MSAASRVLPAFLMIVAGGACTSGGPSSVKACAAAELKEVSEAKVPCEAPRRVVTLMPSLAEMVHALDGNGERIVGVSEYTDFPTELKSKPSVGPYQSVNLEQIRALKPDLILASRDGNTEDQIRRLREWGYVVGVVDTTSLDRIISALDHVSRLVHAPEAGKRLQEKFRNDMESIAEKARNSGPVKRIMLQLGDEPLIVAGGKTYLNEAIFLTGAENVYEDSPQGYPRVSYEDVVKRNPDMILIMSLNGDEKSFEEMSRRWLRFPSMKAVKNRSVRILRADALVRPGIRVLEGVRALQESVYPEPKEKVKQ